MFLVPDVAALARLCHISTERLARFKTAVELVLSLKGGLRWCLCCAKRRGRGLNYGRPISYVYPMCATVGSQANGPRLAALQLTSIYAHHSRVDLVDGINYC